MQIVGLGNDMFCEKTDLEDNSLLRLLNELINYRRFTDLRFAVLRRHTKKS